MRGAHAEGERRPPLLISPRTSSTFLLSLPKKADCYDGGLLWNLSARVKVRKDAGGDGPGALGGGGINVRSCYTGSSHKFEDAQKQTPTQVLSHHKFYIMAL